MLMILHVLKLNYVLIYQLHLLLIIIINYTTCKYCTIFVKIVAISGYVPDERIPPVHTDIREDIPIAPVINAQYIINIAAPFDYLSNITTSIILQHLKPHEMCHE
eukprot:317785_1